MSRWVLTREELREYEKATDTQAAANLLLLVGPDGFEGDYDEEMARMEGGKQK